MSSYSEDTSESEKSCGEMEEPSKSVKIADREGSNSESGHSEKLDEPCSTKASKSVSVAASTSEDSELSSSESEACVENNEKQNTQSGSPLPNHNGETSSEGESDNSAGSKLTLPINVKKEVSSDEASHASESCSSVSSDKKVPKLDRSRKGNDSSNSESAICSKQESSSEISSGDEDTACQTTSSERNRKKSKLFATTKLKGVTQSSDTDERSLSSLSGDEKDPENTKVQPLVKGNTYCFSEKNLINHSSALINVEALSNNDLWLIHSPRMLSDKDLLGVNINFNSGAHHKIGKKKYQISPYPEKGAVACVIPSKITKDFAVVGLPVKGSVVFEESVKLPKAVKSQLTSKDGVQFPENLKVRHPLFGADYKERLSKSMELKRRMKSSEKRISKGKDRLATGNENVVCRAYLMGTKLDKPPEKRKKRDSMTDSHSATTKCQRERVSERNEPVNNESSLKSPKKRKRDKVENDAGLSELAASSQLKKRKIMKSEGDAGLNQSVTSSKGKKRKVDNSQERLSQMPSLERSYRESGDEDTFIKTTVNIKEEVLSSSEMSSEEEKRKKKKKKKEKRKSKSDS